MGMQKPLVISGELAVDCGCLDDDDTAPILKCYVYTL